MRFEPIINSILDNDFYKFTMQNAVSKLFPSAVVRYKFGNRGNHKFPEGFGDALKEQVDSMSNLELSSSEKKYLAKKCPYLDNVYLDLLSGYNYDPKEVKITQNGEDLDIEIEGLWYRTILWEVPLMAIISELYYQMMEQERFSDSLVICAAEHKILSYKKLGVKIAEFGTRRRHSYKVQELVVQTLQKCGSGTYIGTSNVKLAMNNNVIPIGTHAHEWFMFHASLYGYKLATSMALENWANVYRGDLGIALSDTFTTNSFIESFDKKLAKLFDGVRHDSGSPIEFIDKMCKHYKSLNIDPLTKTIIFSDDLTPEKVKKIANYCKDKIGMSFGIGTNFTNDVGLEALNMVIKISQAKPMGDQWVNCIKLSDTEGKYTGDKDTIQLAKQILNIK